MTPTQLAEIRALLDAATPGPWEAAGGSDNIVCHRGNVVARVDPYGLNVRSGIDRALIAAAPTALRELLAYCEELEARLHELELHNGEHECGAAKVIRDAEARGMEEAADMFQAACREDAKICDADPVEYFAWPVSNRIRALAAQKRGSP